MTNYVADLQGSHPIFQRDAAALVASLSTEATVIDGVIRWDANNQVPPADCVALAAHIGLPVDIAKCDGARSADVSIAIATYREARARLTPEQKREEDFERRAAFGAGATVVNIITGESFRT
jgi:hypothetical protein